MEVPREVWEWLTDLHALAVDQPTFKVRMVSQCWLSMHAGMARHSQTLMPSCGPCSHAQGDRAVLSDEDTALAESGIMVGRLLEHIGSELGMEVQLQLSEVRRHNSVLLASL